MIGLARKCKADIFHNVHNFLDELSTGMLETEWTHRSLIYKALRYE